MLEVIRVNGHSMGDEITDVNETGTESQRRGQLLSLY